MSRQKEIDSLAWAQIELAKAALEMLDSDTDALDEDVIRQLAETVLDLDESLAAGEPLPTTWTNPRDEEEAWIKARVINVIGKA